MSAVQLPIIGVMGSHLHEWPELAEPIAAYIARSGCHLLTGGGQGVMTAAARAFCGVTPRRGASIGILPTEENSGGRYVPRAGFPNPWVEIPIVTPLSIGMGGTISRNYVNILTCAAVIALPGNLGTRDEVMLALRFGKPLLCYGPKEEFADFPPGFAQTESFAAVQAFLTPWTSPP